MGGNSTPSQPPIIQYKSNKKATLKQEIIKEKMKTPPIHLFFIEFFKREGEDKDGRIP